MPAPPTGTVTFLFTDIEGSTRLWEAHPEKMKADLETHDKLLREVIESHNGHVFKTMGDAFCAAFDAGGDAVEAALDGQTQLAAETWGVPDFKCEWASTPAKPTSETATTSDRQLTASPDC